MLSTVEERIMKRRNSVKKNMDRFHKPKVESNRKKEYSRTWARKRIVEQEMRGDVY